ncbi:MAG: NAD(P)H-hydrate dehydratase [Comamonadaceae bacterium]
MPVLTTEATRTIETHATSALGSGVLMRRAGEAVARLALACNPHTHIFWIACGPGNNGGDGLEAAIVIRQLGKQVWVSHLGLHFKSSIETQDAYARAQKAGIAISIHPPVLFDSVIDALFGNGGARSEPSPYDAWMQQIIASGKQVLSIDAPSGLNSDTGETNLVCIRAETTLVLLTLKPGLLMDEGRDVCGNLWLHRLGLDEICEPRTLLNAPSSLSPRPHASHKGSFGDVGIVGGAQGMTGAALLAATSALHGGAGRVYLALLQDRIDFPVVTLQSELMLRHWSDMSLEDMTVVAGCGAGNAIQESLPVLLKRAKRLVLDADALNQIASSPSLIDLLQDRAEGSTVLTPHPLEAARLLNTNTAAIQKDRLCAARILCSQFRCTVVLKGSGTLIADTRHGIRINITGNARLATAGTGDVLAGLIGAHWSVQGVSAYQAACSAVYQHGLIADQWPNEKTLTAHALALACTKG